MSVDPYLDLDHGVLKNRLGITDARTLAEAEGAASTLRLAQLIRSPIPGGYDLPHLQLLHYFVFGDVYPWAGRLRTVRIGRGQLFCLPERLEDDGRDVFGRLAAADHLRGRDRDAFLDGLAGFLGEVNTLHPFRDGNGRTQRAFFRQLAHDAGWHLDWTYLEAGRNRDASRAAYDGDTAPLRALLDELVTPLG